MHSIVKEALCKPNNYVCSLPIFVHLCKEIAAAELKVNRDILISALGVRCRRLKIAIVGLSLATVLATK